MKKIVLVMISLISINNANAVESKSYTYCAPGGVLMSCTDGTCRPVSFCL